MMIQSLLLGWLFRLNLHFFFRLSDLPFQVRFTNRALTFLLLSYPWMKSYAMAVTGGSKVQIDAKILFSCILLTILVSHLLLRYSTARISVIGDDMWGLRYLQSRNCRYWWHIWKTRCWFTTPYLLVKMQQHGNILVTQFFAQEHTRHCHFVTQLVSFGKSWMSITANRTKPYISRHKKKCVVSLREI